MKLTEVECVALLDVLKRVRTGDDESDGVYRRGGTLEKKLQNGGEFDDLDRYMLLRALMDVPEQGQLVYSLAYKLASN